MKEGYHQIDIGASITIMARTDWCSKRVEVTDGLG